MENCVFFADTLPPTLNYKLRGSLGGMRTYARHTITDCLRVIRATCRSTAPSWAGFVVRWLALDDFLRFAGKVAAAERRHPPTTPASPDRDIVLRYQRSAVERQSIIQSTGMDSAPKEAHHHRKRQEHQKQAHHHYRHRPPRPQATAKNSRQTQPAPWVHWSTSDGQPVQ